MNKYTKYGDICNFLKGAGYSQKLIAIAFLTIADGNIEKMDKISDLPIPVQLDLFKKIENFVDEMQGEAASTFKKYEVAE